MQPESTLPSTQEGGWGIPASTQGLLVEECVTPGLFLLRIRRRVFAFSVQKMNVDGKDFLGPEGPWVKGAGIAIHQVNNSHLLIRDSHVDLCHMLEIVQENCPVSTP